MKLLPVATKLPPTMASYQLITPADGVAVSVKVPAPLLLAPALETTEGNAKVTANVRAVPFPQAVTGVALTFPGVAEVSTVIALLLPPVC